ncbi:hypothetical protein METY_0648 [Methylopila sp. Yamaguchi]|nr:hypothetical protein METY_0648 [Methylopila sp. Yamaguchi]
MLWWTLMLTAGSGGPTLALRRAIGGALHLLAFGLPLAFLTVLVMATARFGMRAWPIWLLAPVALSPALYAAHLAIGV